MRKANGLILVLATLFAMPAYAGDISISGDIGVFSQYVARGLSYTAGKPVVQGEIVASNGTLSASIWFSNAYMPHQPRSMPGAM